MTRLLSSQTYSDTYEYHGNTAIEHTRTLAGEIVLRDWIMFDTVEEASEYFNDECTE